MSGVRQSSLLAEALKKLDADPSPAGYLSTARTLAADSGDRDAVRVSLLASFTVQPLVPYLAVEMARHGMALVEYVGLFNGVVQELVTPSSGAIAHRPDVVIIVQALDDVAPVLARDFSFVTPEELTAVSERLVTDSTQALRQFRRQSTVPVVVASFWPPPRAGAGSPYTLAAAAQAAAVRRLNARLADDLAAVPDVHVFDLERVTGEIGSRTWWDDKSWHMARAPLSARALPVVANRLASLVAAIRYPPRKCLVVDLDDTLWGGVLGELGPLGIHIGPEFPGSVFRDFQRLLRGLRHRGVLLAVNSKNNISDVREAFATNPHMVLSLDDFAAVRANWRSKPENMLDIARDLNIGVDSLVFADNNPVEQALMRQTLPDVMTLDLPSQPLVFAGIVDGCGAFDQVRVTEEDRRRTEMYQAQSERRQLETDSVNLDDFLASLRMTVETAPLTDRSKDRAVELLRKTNQFNVTTRRHSAAEVDLLMADPSTGVFTVRVTDRFGDNGIVGLAIIRDVGDAVAAIDTLLLSCRVIGRKVETAVLAFLVGWARDRGLRTLRGQFIPTARNTPAADCFERHGFVRLGDDGGEWWELAVALDAVAVPDYVSIAEVRR